MRTCLRWQTSAKCRGLTNVNFGWCPNLTDAAVVELADKCSGLAHAEFDGCENLTDAAALGLAETCRGLTDVNFYRCSKLTEAAKAASRAQLPNCNFIF